MLRICRAQGQLASRKHVLLTVNSNSTALRLVATKGRPRLLYTVTQFTVSSLCCQISLISQAPGLVSLTWLPYILISQLYSIGNKYPCEFCVCVCWDYISLAYWVCLVKLYVDLYFPLPFNKDDKDFFFLKPLFDSFFSLFGTFHFCSVTDVYSFSLKNVMSVISSDPNTESSSPHIPWFHEEPW